MLIASICLVYIALFWGLTSSCLWFDEIFSVHAAEHSWNSLVSFVALDLIHPPLFYALLKIWISIVGENLFWLRLFSIVFSTIALIPFVLLCRELKLRFWTVMLALLFLAVNGPLIKHAQEVHVQPFFCASLFSLLGFLRKVFQCGQIKVLSGLF